MGTGTKLSLAAIGVVALGLAGWWAVADAGPRELRTQSAVARRDQAASDVPPVAATAARTGPRAAVAPPSASVGGAREKPPRGGLLGRVVAADGTAIAGIDVGIWRDVDPVADPDAEPHDTSTTDAGGRFEVEALAGGWIGVLSDGWTVLYHPTVGPLDQAARSPIELLALPAVDGTGVVVSEDGHPLAGVRVRGEVDFSVYLSRSDGRDGGRVEEREARTRQDGSFELRGLPLLDGSSLVFEHPGFRMRRVAVAEVSAGPGVIVLDRVAAAPGHLTGRVVDGSGAAVPGAWVTTGGLAQQTGEDGAFQVRINELPSAAATTVRAVAEGRLPVEREVELPRAEPVELVLDLPSLSIDGAIERRTGGDVLVWLGGTQSFGVIDGPVDGVTFRRDATCEALMAGLAGAGPSPGVRTRRRFAFDGLRDVAYDVHAVDVETLETVTLSDVPAGTSGLLLRWPDSSEVRRLAGRVTDADGRGLAGIRIEARLPWTPTTPELESWPAATTDGAGRFAFPEMVCRQVELVARDPASRFLTERVVLDGAEDREAVEIALVRVVRARFEVEAPSDASGYVQVLGADGVVLPVRFVHAGRDSLTDRAFVEEGRSGVVWFPDKAVLARFVADDGSREVPIGPSQWADGVVTIR